MNALEKQASIRRIAVENRFDPKKNSVMIGERANNICPTCGGTLESGLANIPFVFDDTVIIVKSVPAEICSDCREPFVAGLVTDQVASLLNKVRIEGDHS